MSEKDRSYPACKGMNCGCTDGVSHSAECEAEHAACAAGGVFISGDEYSARLISSAPDLLEALEFLMSAHGEQLGAAFAQAQAAIAKARGN